MAQVTRRGYTPPQTRSFAGKTYSFHGSYAHRFDAEAVQEELREKGWNVRITKNRHPVKSGELIFVLYKRRGKRKPKRD